MKMARYTDSLDDVQDIHTIKVAQIPFIVVTLFQLIYHYTYFSHNQCYAACVFMVIIYPYAKDFDLPRIYIT